MAVARAQRKLARIGGRRLAACSLAVAGALAAAAAQADIHRHAGDLLALTMPATTLIGEVARGEIDGARQFGSAFVAGAVATLALKRTVPVERPDQTNRRSFPSGHAMSAFSSASYLHRRYGFDRAWPHYLAATYVGYTRVHAERHRWSDVAGAAAVSVAASWWLVEPQPGVGLTVLPVFDRGYAGIVLRAAW